MAKTTNQGASNESTRPGRGFNHPGVMWRDLRPGETAPSVIRDKIEDDEAPLIRAPNKPGVVE